ncbi:hypothetical protein R1sor_013086 [Riccia sorocarpa]|uniref:Leucine-rich repeat-containing N-terminal plant-type domain-containing protein n=1 Tax=Riccia sorocarpa TaxID=122646 RepID=A0ABD3H5H8_9MARC
MADIWVGRCRQWLWTLFVLVSSARLSTGQICALQDSAALLELKAGFIDEAGYFSDWNTSTDCCSWQGVTCDLGRVMELKINAFFTPGFPVRDTAYGRHVGATLGDLTALQSLNIENVLFNAAIPISLGNLINLEMLKMRGAGLVGDIPESFCSLSKVKILDLTENEIVGTLPSCVSAWEEITVIRLAANQMSGEIPEVLAKLSTVEELDLAENELVGAIPSSLCQLQKLEVLLLSGNALESYIPSTLTQIKSLRVVALNRNQFTGGISSWWYRLENLTDLRLNDNQLSGPLFLPGWTETFAPLKTLFLQNNKFSGSIPETLGNFQGPLTIDLSSNGFTGTIPESLGNNTYGTLILSNNQLTGGFPLSLTRMQTVMANRNSLDVLTGVGSVPTDGFNVINELGLGQNRFAGPWPTWITELVNLTSLDVSGNNITVDLSGINVTGGIPIALEILKSLDYSLNASHNPLNIPIPCGDFVSNVGILDLTDTGLTGTFDSCFFRSFPLVSSLYLGENQLEGELPSDMQGLLNPTTNILDLSNNRFVGKCFSGDLVDLNVDLPRMVHTESVSISYTTLVFSQILKKVITYCSASSEKMPAYNAHTRKGFLRHDTNRQVCWSFVVWFYGAKSKTLSYDSNTGSLQVMVNLTTSSFQPDLVQPLVPSLVKEFLQILS